MGGGRSRWEGGQEGAKCSGRGRAKGGSGCEQVGQQREAPECCGKGGSIGTEGGGRGQQEVGVG